MSQDYRGYSQQEIEEIERGIRTLESMKKASKAEFEAELSKLNTSLNAVRGTAHASVAKMKDYHEQIIKAIREYEHLQKTELRDDLIDSFENPREITKRFDNMGKVNAEIARRREADQKNGNEGTARTKPIKAREDEERKRV